LATVRPGRVDIAGWTALLTVAVAATLAMTGCANKSTNPEGADDAIPYKARTSPNNVIYNLVLAYTEMDAEGYLDCLSEDFEFVLNPDDVNDPQNPLPETWGKSVEQAIHERMFSDTTNVDRVNLTLTNMSIDFDPGSDPYSAEDDRYTYVEGCDLRVVIGYWTFLADNYQEFVFGIDFGERGRDGELLWKIVEWFDVRPAERSESSTWGSIKALYR